MEETRSNRAKTPRVDRSEATPPAQPKAGRRRPAETAAAHAPSLDALIANLPGNVYRRVRSPDGRYHFEFLSSGLFRHFGIDHLRLLNQKNVRFDWVHPQDRARFRADLELSAAMLSLLDHRVRIVGEGGRVYWARGIARPKRRADGSVVWDGLVIDVTREIEAEAALHVAKEEAVRSQQATTRVVGDLAQRLERPLGELDALMAIVTQRTGHGAAIAAAIAECRRAAADVLGAAGVTQGTSRRGADGAAALTRRQGEVMRLMIEGALEQSYRAAARDHARHGQAACRRRAARDERDVAPRDRPEGEPRRHVVLRSLRLSLRPSPKAPAEPCRDRRRARCRMRSRRRRNRLRRVR